MATDATTESAELQATLQRGEVPAVLRPDVKAIWRQSSGQTLIGAGFVTLFVLLLLVAPWLIAGFKPETAAVWIFPVLIGGVIFILYLLLVAEHIRRRRALEQDAAAGQVSTATGEVFWKRSNYQPRFEGQRNWSAGFYQYNGLMPGPYRFYYLPRSGYVLRIEPLPGDGSRQALTEALGRALGVQTADLELNRRGTLSPRQRQRLWLSAGWRALVGLVLLAYLIFTIAVSLRAAILQSGAVAAAVEYVLVMAFLIIVIGYLALTAWRTARAASGGVVDRLTGRVEMQSTDSIFGQVHVTVQREPLSLSGTVWNALIAGQDYACYVAPHAREVVAIEPIEASA